MSSVVIAGDTSGSITLAAPAVAGTTTLTLPATTATIATNVNGNLYPLVSGTAVASTSGTSIDFTSIPSWVKRITVMFNGVSTNGTSAFLIQIGAGSVTTSGYASQSGNRATDSTSTIGFLTNVSGGAAYLWSGMATIATLGSNIWVESGTIDASAAGSSVNFSAGGVTLGGTLDRVRITTVNGTDTFDAGSINILYE